MIRGNRRALRERGLTSADILALEVIAFQQEQGRVRSVRISALARLLGVSRQSVHRRLDRLHAAGAVVAIGRGVFLNVRGLLRWCAKAALDRLAAVRRSFERKKAPSVNARCATEGKKEETTVETGLDASLQVFGTVAENRAALAALYVPLHLRRVRT